jgi:hypothetical protein
MCPIAVEPTGSRVVTMIDLCGQRVFDLRHWLTPFFFVRRGPTYALETPIRFGTLEWAY